MRVRGKLLVVAGIAALAAYWFAAWAQATKPLRGDIIPARQVFDPYPVFNGIAVDGANNLVAMTDVNRKSLLDYDRAGNSGNADEQTPVKHHIMGPETNLGFVAGVLLDPEKREMYAVNNDIEDTMVVMRYGSEGNRKPARILSVPHQAWGVALGRAKDQIAISVELHQAIVFYRREANGVEPPVRYIRGGDTKLADPHGIYWDETHNEIGVANHGNFRGLVRDLGSGCVPTGTADAEGGEFQLPSITIYSADAEGNHKPLRVIQGPHTKLDFPMGVAVDAAHGEIAVANNGDSSILIFSRSASGDAAPVRVIKGAQSGVNRPMGVAIDAKNDEIWVANFGDHSAVAFRRGDVGDARPKRIIRSAPAGTPVSGFGNPQTLAYDSKREQILAPN